MAYDPEADLVYVGTGNAEPWPQQLRTATAKDNLYVCSILAVNVDTGELKWHYQVVPGDIWDFDSVQQLMLADLTINGRPRKVIMQANKNGFFYVLDRLTGEFISAAPFSPRQPGPRGSIRRPAGRSSTRRRYYGTEPITISPGGGGAHNWSPMSFNPGAGLVYIPTSTSNSWTYAAEPKFDPQPGTHDRHRAADAGGRRSPPPPAIGPEPIEGPGGRGALVAWDPVAQQMRWRMPGGGGIGGGTMTTAGNLVFQVDQRRTSHRLQRRQGREAARDSDRPAQRHGPADHLSARRQAVHRADGWRGQRPRRRQRRPRQSADAVFAEAADVRAWRQRGDISPTVRSITKTRRP